MNGRRRFSHSAPARPIESASAAVAARDGWNHSGGTTIIVGTNDTLEGLSHRYGVSTAEILKANGYRSPRRLQPGQRLIIPKRAAVADIHYPLRPRSLRAATASGIHYVNRGDTLMSIARRNHIPVKELARANGLPPSAKLKTGMKITVPTKVAAASARSLLPLLRAYSCTYAGGSRGCCTRGPVQKVNLAVATATPEAAVVKHSVKAAEATGALPTFRWPVRGRVITAYGAKTNGKYNDGINVAVPEGTPVKAAEDGVVAYSGNELKGYGNLVLVRHSNGYVTAYAHASDLLVKRGDTIKRGQVIAKSGQSGEAGSPQLHFEIRKGSTPVDPLQFPQRGMRPCPGRGASRLRCSDRSAKRLRRPRIMQRITSCCAHPGTSLRLRRRQLYAEPTREFLRELPGDAAGARAARGRPFQRLALQFGSASLMPKCAA